MTPAVIRRLAQADVRQAREWYERERPGLGSGFTGEVNRVMARVGALPLQFSEVRPGVRRALVRRFPYAIYFVFGKLDVPTVIAVLHQHQDSRELEARLGPKAGPDLPEPGSVPAM